MDGWPDVEVPVDELIAERDEIAGQAAILRRLVRTLWARQLPGFVGTSWEHPFAYPDGVTEDEAWALDGALGEGVG